jgi:mono/diheme cytochrome c family protein
MSRAGIFLICFVPMMNAAHAAPSIVSQGKKFAIEACSACHQVRPDQVAPPAVHDANFDEDVVAPSFMQIARTHGANIEYLRKHITEPEWPMREQQLDDYYLYDIIAYIQSLAPKPAATRSK